MFFVSVDSGVGQFVHCLAPFLFYRVAVMTLGEVVTAFDCEHIFGENFGGKLSDHHSPWILTYWIHKKVFMTF